MARKVIVGGFASSERLISRVAGELSEHLDEEIAGMSFYDAVTHPAELEKLVREADVYTHSAGMMAIRGASPESITAIAPPLPTGKISLVTRASRSMYGLAASSFLSGERRESVQNCGLEALKAVVTHPIGHVGQIGRIGLFSAINIAGAAQEAGIPTRLAFMDRDAFFRPDEEDRVRASKMGVQVLSLAGHHDEFLVQPFPTYVELEAKSWAEEITVVPSATEELHVQSKAPSARQKRAV